MYGLVLATSLQEPGFQEVATWTLVETGDK